MICNKCGCNSECEWYKSYKKIEQEIYLGIGTNDNIGKALLDALNNNPLEECEFFE